MGSGGRRPGSERAPARSRRGRLAALGCLVLLAALLVPAGSAAAQVRIGTVDASISPEADVPRMGTANVDVLRILFSWQAIETRRASPGQCNAGYNWTKPDRTVRQASQHGVELLPYLVGSPPYAFGPRGSSRNAPHSSSAAFHDYRCFVREVAARYGRGGTFPRLTGAAPITQYQLWNEPNLKGYAARNDPNPREYSRLLRAGRQEIFRTDTNARIVLAGMPEFVDRGTDALPYLRRLYRIPGIERSFDVVALHPYARNYRGVEGAMIRLRGLLRQVGDRRRQVSLTEMGWATKRNGNHFINKSEKEQARQLKKAYRMLRRNDGRFKLDVVHWFRWRDASPQSANDTVFAYAGLYKHGGAPKQSCRAFAGIAGGQCRRINGLGASASVTPTSSAAAAASREAAENVLPSEPE